MDVSPFMSASNVSTQQCKTTYTLNYVLQTPAATAKFRQVNLHQQNRKIVTLKPDFFKPAAGWPKLVFYQLSKGY